MKPFTPRREQLLDYLAQSIHHIIGPLCRVLKAQAYICYPSNSGIEPLPLEGTMPEHHLSQADLQLPHSFHDLSQHRNHSLRCRRRRRRSEIGDEVGKRHIDFMADSRHHWNMGSCNGPHHDLFVETPEIFQRSSASPDNDDIHKIQFVQGG